MNNEISTRKRTLGLISVLIAGLVLVALAVAAVFNIKDDNAEVPETKPRETASAGNEASYSETEASGAELDADSDIYEDEQADAVVTGESDNGEDAPASANPVKEAAPQKSAPTVPTFTAPVDGSVTKTHDSDMLVYSVTMNDYRVHIGVDVAAETGAPVYACADGTVSKVIEEPFMGYTVVIDHGNGYTSTCHNLSDIIPEGISEGVSVKAGDIIGSVGDSALAEIADQPHLHFELEKDGLPLDPLDFVTFNAEVDYSE